MRAILRELDLDDKVYPPKSVLARLDSARDELLSPELFAQRYGASGDVRLRKTAEIYKLYAQRLFAAGAMDFDDLLYNTVRLFRECPDVLEHYQRQFKYVLIDEYQDTNNLQYMLASMLAGGWGNICVVGDDDQSIYKFRGATIENILSFEKEFKGCRTIRLEQNYRSTGHILGRGQRRHRQQHRAQGQDALDQRRRRGQAPALHGPERGRRGAVRRLAHPRLARRRRELPRLRRALPHERAVQPP